MIKYLMVIFLTLILFGFSACELDADNRRLALVAQPTDRSTSTPAAPAATSTPTIPASPTPTSTPTPIPTETPISGARLETAQNAYASGDYETARVEFDQLLADPGADANEQRLALYWRGRSEIELADAAAAVATLQQFLQQYPTDELTRAAQFNLGRAYEQLGQPLEAIAAFSQAIAPSDAVNVYIHERIGDIWLQTGAYTETIAAYQTGIDSTTDSSFQVHLRESIAEAERQHNNLGAAIAQYEDILKIAEIDAYRAKILKLLGDTLAEAGDKEASRQRYLEAVNLYPEAPDSHLALVELVVNDNVPVDDFQRGLVNYHAKSYWPAVAAFERYLTPPAVPTEPLTVTTSLTGTELLTGTSTVTTTETLTGTAAAATTPAQPSLPSNAGDALWYMALSLQGVGQYDSAIAAFQRLINEFPTSSPWGEAHIQMGQTLINQGNYTQAQTVLRNFATNNPGHPLADEALWRPARLDFNLDRFDQARTHFLELVDKYPTSQYAGDALYWAGQSAYNQGDYETAIADWAKLTQLYRDSSLVSYAGYWRAKTLMRLGRNDEASAVLAEMVKEPADYYRLRARDLLTGQQPHSVPINLPTKAELVAEQAEAENWLRQWIGELPAENLANVSDSIRDDPAFQRGEALLEFGLRDKALIEFEMVKDNWWDDPLAMYQLAVYFHEKHLGRLSILAAARLVFLSPAEAPEQTPIYIQRLYYPVLFEDVIFEEAEKLQVDPALLVALIRQESLFEFSAKSIAGARGLMQVMPTTGEYIAERSDFGQFQTDQLWLPFISIRFGTWYLNQQLGIFNGNQFAALAAYNAGPGNVQEWVKVSDDLDIFVESIPFWESRTYIRRIYENLAAYRRIYGTSSDSPQ